MKKYLIAAALIGAFVTPALSQAGEWYVGFDTATKKCSVVSSMPSGMKMMGKYKSKAEAETAMHGMKECPTGFVGNGLRTVPVVPAFDVRLPDVFAARLVQTP